MFRFFWKTFFWKGNFFISLNAPGLMKDKFTTDWFFWCKIHKILCVLRFFDQKFSWIKSILEFILIKSNWMVVKRISIFFFHYIDWWVFFGGPENIYASKTVFLRLNLYKKVMLCLRYKNKYYSDFYSKKIIKQTEDLIRYTILCHRIF